jgi:membrane protein implicated in regulation of membrane protease activity
MPSIEPENAEVTSNDRTAKAGTRFLLQSALAVVIGSLCCLTPVVLVLFGLASISTAVSLDDLLTGHYGWAFRLAGLSLLTLALIMYFRRRGVCTLDEARRQRNRIIKGHRGNEWVKVGHFSLKSEAASRSGLSV